MVRKKPDPKPASLGPLSDAIGELAKTRHTRPDSVGAKHATTTVSVGPKDRVSIQLRGMASATLFPMHVEKVIVERDAVEQIVWTGSNYTELHAWVKGWGLGEPGISWDRDTNIVTVTEVVDHGGAATINIGIGHTLSRDTEHDCFVLSGPKYTFIYEADQDHDGMRDRFAHRIVIESPMGRLEGEWTSYTGIARLDAGGESFFAVTAYHDGTFPIEKVLRFGEAK